MKSLKEHKKNLKKLSKSELIQKVLTLTEIDIHRKNEFYMAYEELDNEKQIAESELIRTEWFLKSAESAIRMYENMSILGFICHKFK